MPNQIAKLATAGISAVAAQAINGDAATGITAAGTTQATATPLPAANNFIGTAAASSGVILPPGNLGDEIFVFNGGANTLAVYPPVGAAINGGATNAAASIATLKTGYFIYGSATLVGAILSA